MSSHSVFLPDEASQEKLAAEFAHHVSRGTVIFLQGDLGTGKTTFVRGFLRALGHQGVVKSPTYTLVEPYDIDHKRIYHFDLYRLAEPDELEYAGGRDYFDGESICLVEWPEKAEGFLPVADISCLLCYEDKGRRMEYVANTDKGKNILDSISY
ncbi:MAG: tRNA (adenosine(37)-N6)-threonylcarbamoyltransferase complex ATPase subunit type 1 TsaE [Gammaproteobacteria bacterium]|nr:tRNA (adenosine(37)-N6)-threonylcarbamoyltransferase complex ATPase subunit type 1 TsaE [Gammaproteobacteria bacterium]